jgi:hypothetical protein
MVISPRGPLVTRMTSPEMAKFVQLRKMRRQQGAQKTALSTANPRCFHQPGDRMKALSVCGMRAFSQEERF